MSWTDIVKWVLSAGSWDDDALWSDTETWSDGLWTDTSS